jgi:Domain of unknown function (DUF4296)
MFNKKIITFCIFCTLFACQSSSDKLPIPEDTLLKVLSDIHKAEVIIGGETPTHKDSLSKKYYQQIFEKHGITTADYDTTLSMLSFRPALMHRIYDKVIKNYQEETKKLTNTGSK